MKRVLGLLVGLILFCSFSSATTVQRLTLDDLVQKAQSIIHGKVRTVRTHWSTDGKIILTTYTIDIEETIKGNSAKSLEVTTIGGKIGDLTLYVSGMPAFDAGESAVVFLERSAGYSTVVGLSQGKFTVTNGEVSNDVSQLSFPDGRGGVPLKMGLADFKRQIRSRIH
jgi:hypothetical protein